MRKTSKLYRNNAIFVIQIVSLTVGAFIRILYCVKYPTPVRDSFEYIDQIKQWSETGTLSVDGMIVPLGLFILKIPNSFWSIRLFQGSIILNNIFGLAIILSIIKILKISKSNSLILLGALIAATHPSLVAFSCEMLRENSYLLMICFSIIAFENYIFKNKITYLCLCAMWVCFAFLCRNEALELLVLFSLAIPFVTPSKKSCFDILLFNIVFVLVLLIVLGFFGISVFDFINALILSLNKSQPLVQI